MNNEALKYLAFGFMGLYVYNSIKGKGMTPQLGSAIQKTDLVLDRAFSNIPNPEVRDSLKRAAKALAKDKLMRQANIRDVTPIGDKQ